MKTSWFIGLFTLFIVLSLLSGIMELAYLGGSEDHSNVISTLMTAQIDTSTGLLGIVWSSLVLTKDIIVAIWSALWFDYAFFTGQYQIIRWAFFIPLSIGLIVSLLMAIRGTSSA